MNAAVESFRWRHDSERAFAPALIERASVEAILIRQRLAIVAQELRQAAAAAGPKCEGLLNLANRFEQNSRPGDNA